MQEYSQTLKMLMVFEVFSANAFCVASIGEIIILYKAT